LQLEQPDTGTSTLIAVTVGALLATVGGVVASQLENRLRKRERERNAALLVGEILSTLELILSLAADSRGRGEPYGPVTMRLIAAGRREMDIYDRNRESLYDLRDADTRVMIHSLAIRVSMALDALLEATPAIAAVELSAKAPGLSKKAKEEIAERLERMRASRDAGFDFAMDMAKQTKPVVAKLGLLARHSFDTVQRVGQDVGVVSD
jgi:hypothetical protein